MKTPTNITSTGPGQVRCIALLLGALTLAGYLQAQTKPVNPDVIAPSGKYLGLSYSDWAARWWISIFSIPVVDGNHPNITGGAFGGEQGMLFLSGAGFPAGAGVAATFDITIPAGTALLFPVVNAECSILEPDPFHGTDETSLRACANSWIDNTSGHFAIVDGVPVSNLDAYREQSPLFVFGPLPENNVFEFLGLDAPAGTTSPSVDAGVYLLLAPLSPGKHVLHFGATFNVDGFYFDTTFNITVLPKKRSGAANE
jgi:hypothetical protein